MNKSAFKLMSLALVTLVFGGLQWPAWAQKWQPGSENYEYNAGPAAAEKMAGEIIDLYAAQPENRYISDELSPEQKFRFTFGAMMLRTNFAADSVKIFAIGQDAVDDAELVKLPGTGTGYSTRVQSIANHHGVDQSLATSNASFQTIKGQYGSFDHVFVELGADGKPQIQQSKFIDNYLWAMFNGKSSAIAAHREKAWEWEIKNNLNSMRLVILFGGAAQDAFAEFLIRRGFRVPSGMAPERLKRIQVPESHLEFAGGNNDFPVLQTKQGKDLYAELLGRKLNYKNKADQTAAINALKAAGPRAVQMMAFTGGGLNGSGIINPAQLGGYDLSKTEKMIGGKWTQTNSLKGLHLSDGTVITSDVAFVASPHPTALSKSADPAKADDEASKTVTKIFASVKNLIGGAQAIEPDLDGDGKPRINHFAKGDPFKYGRAFLPRRVVPFGAPDTILRPHASADRLGPQVLVSEPPSRTDLEAAGIDELAKIFNAAEIESAKKAQPVESLNPDDIWSQHSRQKATRGLADPGPGAEMAHLMVKSLDRGILEKVKAPALGFFAHYRGTFNNPRALIVSDPLDLEDRNTFRAATGKRGQAVNGLMRDLGLDNAQLVLNTAPVDMTDATAQEWETVRSVTEEYREIMLSTVLKGRVEVIFTDGPVAKFEVERILKKLGKATVPVISIERGNDAMSGIAQAGAEAKQKLPQFRGATITGKPGAIAPEQLPWNSRDWERVTSGTVIEAKGKFKGKSYAIVTPNFVATQKLKPLPETAQAVEATKKELTQLGVRPAHESIPAFLSRTGKTGLFDRSGQ